MRVKHAKLDKTPSGELVFYFPSQSKERNTESTYFVRSGVLIMAGKEVAKHPRFKNVPQFEDWCNRYWATHYDETTT